MHPSGMIWGGLMIQPHFFLKPVSDYAAANLRGLLGSTSATRMRDPHTIGQGHGGGGGKHVYLEFWGRFVRD